MTKELDPSINPGYSGTIPVDPNKPDTAIYVHVDGTLFVPSGLVDSLKEVDRRYTENPASQFETIESSLVYMNRGMPGLLIPSPSPARSKELLIVTSPLNDGPPQSTPKTITDFVMSQEKPDVGLAQPNSWRPGAKLLIDATLGDVEQAGMDRLQIFAPEAKYMSSDQRRRVANGDMTVYGELAEPGITLAEEILQKRYESINVFGAGLATKALGVAAWAAASGERELGTVTLMNLSLVKQSLAKRQTNYALRTQVGEDSKLLLPPDFVRIDEMSMLKDLDKHGPEFSMRVRQIQAMRHFRMLRAMLNAKEGVEYIDAALDAGAAVTIANAQNESLTDGTVDSLKGYEDTVNWVDIVGVEGSKVGMMTNELGVLVALVSNLGLRNGFKK